jgi:phosphoribosylformimino-5-aminoimidazole carboxamide ribotide isomerase
MQIIPAIDLKDGKAVRLVKGAMDSAKIYSSSPWEQAKIFQDLGAKWLHIVDLDGAFAGEPKNFDRIIEIRQSTGLNLQVGGGIRDEATIQRYLSIGVSRIILGSIALKNPEFVKEMAQKYPIVVGIDAKDGFVAVDGWADVSEINAIDLAKKFAEANVDGIICTDINRDGMLSGVNIDFVKGMKIASNLYTIASGGVKDIEDIKRLTDEEIDGVIVGKAYYEGTLDLKEAFKVTQN